MYVLNLILDSVSSIVSFFILDINKKKINSTEKKRLDEIETNSCYFVESNLQGMNTLFSPVKKSISPLVDKLQAHLDIFPEEENKERKIAEHGFLNFNLCLNAQTMDVHTECDASYTVIAVPNQIPRKFPAKKKNKGNFELRIDDNRTFVIPMVIGTSFIYSGFLLSHRQQILNEDENIPPFVNTVSYNSKRLFENMLQSFRRYLGED